MVSEEVLQKPEVYVKVFQIHDVSVEVLPKDWVSGDYFCKSKTITILLQTFASS